MKLYSAVQASGNVYIGAPTAKHMDKECTVLFSSAQPLIVTAHPQPPPQSTSTQVGSDKLIAHPN